MESAGANRMRGRKPKPNALQQSEGDPAKRGVHKLQARLEAEPKATRGLPECPRHLRGRARSAWNFWAPELESMSLDRRPDAIMLEGACVNFDSAVRASIECSKNGEVIDDPIVSRETGEVVAFRQKKSPWVSVRERSWTLVRAFCSEFGFSPASRMRLTIENKDDASAELASLLSKPRESRPAVN